jgi:tetratricopeptide (TPR) repeat protein
MTRAERAYAAWLAADRDTMADCHACELHGQGWWQAQRGEDVRALELWQPVLEGEYTCAHEPHTALASSLLPLLRLGRLDEARAHHLRGFRLVRPMESMRGAYADHVEFCSLTGNEARGLELLAERPAYFTDSGEPRSKLDFMSVVALLMDRVTELGMGDQPVPGPAGRSWTARELAAHARGEALSLAARFDERNGTPYVGALARERMSRAPLVDRLPLGVRARIVTAPVRPTSAPTAMDAAAAASTEPDLSALLSEARRLSASLHPQSVAAWAAVAEAAGDEELAPRDRAEMTDHQAMGLGPEGAELFARAAELYAEAGDPGEAMAARARGAYVLALSGRTEKALAAVSEPYERVLALLADGGTGVQQAASVLVGRARILMERAHEAAEESENGLSGDEGGEADEAFAAAESAVRELLALAEPHTGDDLLVASRAAEAHAMLGELAAHAGDVERATELLTGASEAFVAAGLPWFAVEYEARLTGMARHLGDAEAAERAARAALEHGGPYLEATGHAQLHLQLAEVLGATGRFGPAAEHALQAAHWADEGGEGVTLGAWARHQLGGFLVRQGRWAEAAEVLESALPELVAETHGEGALVQTRWWLGDCLSELSEHREAAEHWLQAAETARHWPEQRDHAMLAHLAAEALGNAGLPDQAERAYERAGDLWRSLGNVHGLVRSLRARAWLAAREEGSGLDAARELMTEAVQECEAAAPEDDAARDRLAAELADTHRQFGDLIARSVTGDADDESINAVFEESLAHLTRAITGFASLGEAGLHSRTGAELAAGWLEGDLERPEAAAARARVVLAAYMETDATTDADETVASRRAEAEHLLRMTGAETQEP